MKLFAHCVISCLLCALLAKSAPAQKRHRHSSRRHQVNTWGVPEIFSDLSLEPETGDVGGIEVILIPVYSGDWATVVMGDSVAEDPVLVPVTRDRDNIEFTLPPNTPGESAIKFTGKITPAGLLLRNEGFGVMLLRRQYRNR